MGDPMSVTYTWDLPRDSTAPAQGRWFVREAASNQIEAVDAELVVTELITNAWKHGTGTGPITLTVEIRDDSLRLEVCGEAPGEPVRAPTTTDSEPDGRGMLMIEGLTDRWGYERTGNVVCVWAELPWVS